MSVSWTKDAKKPGALSSMDVLLRWMVRPGNYERWESEATKIRTAEEIVKEMKDQGIKHRTPRCVYFRLHNLKRQYTSVKKWLNDEEQLALFHRGEADEEVEASVLHRCPHFRELAPVFDQDEDEDTASDGEIQDEGEDEGADDANAEEDQTSASQNAQKGANSKRKTASSNSSLSPRKIGKREASLSESLVRIPAAGSLITQDELEEVDVLLKTYPSARSLRGNSEDGGDDNRDAKSVALSGQAGEELTQRLIEVEIERAQALAKVHLDGEKKREEVRTKLDTMLSRHKLKRQGFSDDQVEAIFPL